MNANSTHLKYIATGGKLRDARKSVACGMKSHSQDGPISLHPLTTSQALAAALRVKPADLKRLEDEEKAKKAAKKKRG